MAFYKSKYTGAEIDQRLAQGTYDDALMRGFDGTKEDFDILLAKLKKTSDLASGSQQYEDNRLETVNKTVVDAINELHTELQAKPDEKDVIDQGELEVFKDEIAAKYATKEEIVNNIEDVNVKITTINENLVNSVDTINKNVNDGFNVINQAIQQNAETLVAEINQRKEADKDLSYEIKEGDANLQKNIETLSQNLVQSINQINENVANGFNTINGGIATEISDRKNADAELDSKITQETSDRQTSDNQLSERIETLENAGYQNAEQVKAEIEKIIDFAPETLDTLKEISEALNNDPNFATTITEEVSKKLDSDKLLSGAGIDISEEDNKKIINISNDALTKIQYSDSEVRRLENDKISYAYDEKTQSNINVILPEGGSYLGNYGDENATIAKAAVYDGVKQLEIGSSKIHTNINTDSKVTIETSTGKKTIATIDELVNVVNIPIRNLQDKVYTQEEILDWFNSTDVIDLKNKIVRGSLMYLKFGISLSGNPMYYKMPIEYIAFESANQIKLVFVGLNTRDDVTSKYEILINLDGTIIEGNSNVKLTLLSLEPDLSNFATKEEVPSVFETKGLTELEMGESSANIEAALGIDFTSLIEIIRENKTIIVDRNSAGDYKACIHATGNISSDNGAANLMFFIGTTPTIYQVQYVNGTFALAVDEYEFVMKSELPDTSSFATKSELNTKQDTLVSGTNIRTLNGASLLGEGNIQLNEGTTNYTDLTNKPSINNVTLSGNLSFEDLGLDVNTTWEQVQNKPEFASVATSGSYNDLTNTPTQYIVEEEAALQAGDEQHEFNIKSGGRVTVNSANEVVTYTPYPGETGRKMLVLANNDSLTGTKTDGTGAPLAFMSKWDKIEIGNSTTSLNLNSLNGEITINDDKVVATTDQIQAPYEINLTNLLSAEDSESISTAIGGIDNLNATVQDNRLIVGTISNGSVSVSIRILGNVTTLYYLLDSVLGLTLNEVSIANTSGTLSKSITTHSVLTENMVINSLNSDETTLPLSAAQGKVLNSDKQNKTDETLQTTDKTVVGAINELLAKVQELETKNTELESRLAALEGTN